MRNLSLMKNKIKAVAGFTLLEITVVTAILVIALLGISSLVIQNLQAQNYNHNFLIASMLSQEGLELVRNIRDDNWHNNNPSWKTGTGAGSNTDILQDLSYSIDYTGVIDDTPNNIDDAGARLNITNDGYYVHTGGTPTQYYRIISVLDHSDSIAASSTVKWNYRGQSHIFVASTELYDWE